MPKPTVSVTYPRVGIFSYEAARRFEASLEAANEAGYRAGLAGTAIPALLLDVDPTTDVAIVGVLQAQMQAVALAAYRWGAADREAEA